MALPLTLAGVAFPAELGTHGPFQVGASTYVVLLDSVDASRIEVWASTDPTTSFTEQDAANKPDTTNAILAMGCVLSGTTIHIAASEPVAGTFRLTYHTFNCATNAWATVNETVVTSGVWDTATYASASIVVRSDAMVVILYNGAYEVYMSANRQRVYYAYKPSGGSWTADVAVSPTAVTTNYTGSQLVLTSADRAHFAWSSGTTLGHRTASAANPPVLSTAGTTTADYVGTQGGVIAVGGTNTIFMAGATSTTTTIAKSAADADSPTWSDGTVSSVGVLLQGSRGVHAIVNDGTLDLYAIYSDATTSDLWIDAYRQAAGSAWGVDAELLDAVTIADLSVGCYTRAYQRVIGYVYSDAGTVKYNEYKIRNAYPDGAGGNVTAACGTLLVDTGAVGTTYSVTGLTFRPEAVLLWWAGNTSGTNNTAEQDIRAGIGVIVSPTERGCVTGQIDHAVATSASDGSAYVDSAVATLTTAGALDGKADVASVNSDGFTLVIDDQFAAAVRVSYCALGGAVNAALGYFFAKTGTTGSVDYTTVPFRPSCMIFPAENPNVIGSILADKLTGIGVTGSALSQGFSYAYNDDAQGATNAFSGTFSGECTHGGARATLTAYLSNGFTLNWVVVDATWGSIVIFLALGNCDAMVGTVQTKTNTSDAITVSGLSFKPEAIWFISSGLTLDTVGTFHDHGDLSIGAAAGSSRVAQAFADKDAADPTDCAASIYHDAVYINLDKGTTIAMEGLMDVTALTAGGFAAIMDDADPSAADVLYLAIGEKSPMPLLKAGGPHRGRRTNVLVRR